MLRGSVVQTKIQTGLCASISPKAPTSQFIRRPSSIPSPKGSTPDHVKNSASILHKRLTSLHLPTILLKIVVHLTVDSPLRPFVTSPDILAPGKMMKALNPEHVVPGHGAPGTAKIFDD